MTTPMRIDGVDISHFQSGKIDYDRMLKAGVNWMYHKCTEGTSVKDDNYERRRKEAKSEMLPFGAYHFARPDGGDARTEAQRFINVAQPMTGDLIPALDLEVKDHVSGMPLVRWADEFADEVKSLIGVYPVIYTPFQLSDELEKSTFFWVPRYNNSNAQPTRRWDIWQFSNGVYGVPNSVPGLGHCDINTSKVSVDQLIFRPAVKSTRTGPGIRVESAIKDLSVAERRTEDGTRRDNLLRRALKSLRKI